MAWGAGATIRAAVVLAAEEEAVGPAVVEPQWVLGKAEGAIGNGRIYLRGSIFFVVYDTAGRLATRTVGLRRFLVSLVAQVKI
jgi:hypothetical protein